MRAVVQRVAEAKVIMNNNVIGEIDRGLLVFLGVGNDDSIDDCRYLADKMVHLRIFEDEKAKMNRSVLDIQGAILVVSQFTLWGDCRKGRRPSFVAAAPPELAESLYESFISCLKKHPVKIATGKFREMMQVHLINDGPVTLLLDSRKIF